MQVDMWTSVPSYELVLNGVPRTVLATNKMEDLKLFLDFSIPILNSTQDILNALQVNSGNIIPIHDRNEGNRRFDFEVSSKLQFCVINVIIVVYLFIFLGAVPVPETAFI